MGAMHPYVVRQGDYLAALAMRFGFDATEVWQHPRNAALRRSRPNPDILAPGDILHLPERVEHRLPVSRGTTNRFRARLPSATLRIRLQSDGEALANEPFVVEGAQPNREGTTDGDGVAVFDIALSARRVVLRLPGKGLVFPVGVGHLDPLTEPSGVRARLRQLGYHLPDGPGDRDDGALEHAIRAFQEAHGLEVTGQMNDGTRSELESAHGS